MTVSEMKSVQDISQYVAQADENKMHRLAYEAKTILDSGVVPENSIAALIINQIGCTFMDVCIPVALEYTRREATPF